MKVFKYLQECFMHVVCVSCETFWNFIDLVLRLNSDSIFIIIMILMITTTISHNPLYQYSSIIILDQLIFDWHLSYASNNYNDFLQNTCYICNINNVYIVIYIYVYIIITISRCSVNEISKYFVHIMKILPWWAFEYFREPL